MLWSKRRNVMEKIRISNVTEDLKSELVAWSTGSSALRGGKPE